MLRRSAILAVAILPTVAIDNVAAQQEGSRANGRLFHIVALEPHPLGVPASFYSVIAGPGGGLNIVRGLALFNTIAILAEMPEATKRAGDTSSALQAALEQAGEWIPTLVLAQEVRAELSAAGMQAIVDSKVKPIPGMTDRSYTALMENWMAPIRAWYSDTTPTQVYTRPPAEQPEYVLEVGMMNYEIGPGSTLILQVAMKLIDPSSGRIIKRARAANPFSAPSLGTLSVAFENDGMRFKEAFKQTGRELVRKCLAELGVGIAVRE